MSKHLQMCDALLGQSHVVVVTGAAETSASAEATPAADVPQHAATAQPNEAPTPENFGPRLGTSTAGGPSRADSPAGAAAAAAISNLGNPSNFRNRQLDSAAGHEARGSKDVVPAQGQSGTTFQMRNPEPVVEPARGPRVLEMPNLLDGEPNARGLLEDLISDYKRWNQVDATLHTSSKEVLYAVEERVKAEGPETLRPKLQQTWREVLAAAKEDGLMGFPKTLRCGCLRIMLLILDGKNDIHCKQITKEALRERILDVLGLGAQSDRLLEHVPKTRKRQAAESEEGAFRKGKEKAKTEDEMNEKAKVGEGSGDEARMSKRQRTGALRETFLRLVKDLMNEPCADRFRLPIEASEVPGYYETIKSPMCLETIHAKIKQDELHYAAEDLFADMELIKTNAETFNRATNPVIAQQAASLFELFVRNFCAAIDELKQPKD